MYELNDLYEQLEKEYTVEWLNGEKAFELFFSVMEKNYKIYIDEKYIGFFVKNKVFKKEYWHDLSHVHYDNPSDTVETQYQDIILWMKEHGYE